jgi:hypothetical protein
MGMTQTMNREIHVTRNGHTVELRHLGHATRVISPDFTATYRDEAFARRVANIRFVWLTVGCYACALDKVGRTVLDKAEHTH